MVELNNLRTLLKRSVLYLNTNQSNHLRLRNQYCLRGRFKHYLNEGGWGHKTGIKLCIYHPINLHGVEFRFVNLFN